MSLESDNSSFWVESDDDYDIPEPKSDFEFNVSAETFEYECYSFVKGDFEFLQNVDLVVNGIVGLPVAVVGIGINLFFLVVLCGARLRRVLLNQLLISLAVINLVSLVSRIIRICDKTFHMQVYLHIVLFPYLVYPLQSIALTATIYMTVAIVHERYSVVSGQKAIRTDSEKRKKLAIYLSAVLILALVVNLPKFFELTWAQIGQMSFLVPTALRTNPYYSIFYICWTRLIFWKILPHSLLIFFCYKIYRAAQLATSQADNQTQVNNVLSHERRLASIFMLIVLAFFVCYLPATILNINEAVSINQLVYCHERHRNGLSLWVLCLTDISNFCLYLFSAVNLLFVFLPSSGYRKHCCKILRCNKQRLHDDSDVVTQEDVTDVADRQSLTEFETQFDQEITTSTTRTISNREMIRNKFVTSEIINL